MVLVDHEILSKIKNDGIIRNYKKNCITNIGYDLRAKCFVVSNDRLPRVELQPGDSAFVETEEVISMPTDLMGQVVLKSSRCRQGLSIESPIYQPGNKTRVYFRLTNLSGDNILLSANEQYAMIVFTKLSSIPNDPYDGAFQDEYEFRGLGAYQNVYKWQMHEFEKKEEDIKALENSIYANVLTILSIFVALFTLLTINVTLAANSANIQQFSIFNALMLGCISFLVTLIRTITKPDQRNIRNWYPAIISFIIALILYYY